MKIKFATLRGGGGEKWGAERENRPKHCFFFVETPRQLNFECANFIVEKFCCHCARLLIVIVVCPHVCCLSSLFFFQISEFFAWRLTTWAPTLYKNPSPPCVCGAKNYHLSMSKTLTSIFYIFNIPENLVAQIARCHRDVRCDSNCAPPNR